MAMAMVIIQIILGRKTPTIFKVVIHTETHLMICITSTTIPQNITTTGRQTMPIAITIELKRNFCLCLCSLLSTLNFALPLILIQGYLLQILQILSNLKLVKQNKQI